MLKKMYLCIISGGCFFAIIASELPKKIPIPPRPKNPAPQDQKILFQEKGVTKQRMHTSKEELEKFPFWKGMAEDLGVLPPRLSLEKSEKVNAETFALLREINKAYDALSQLSKDLLLTDKSAGIYTVPPEIDKILAPHNGIFLYQTLNACDYFGIEDTRRDLLIYKIANTLMEGSPKSLGLCNYLANNIVNVYDFAFAKIIMNTILTKQTKAHLDTSIEPLRLQSNEAISSRRFLDTNPGGKVYLTPTCSSSNCFLVTTDINNTDCYIVMSEGAIKIFIDALQYPAADIINEKDMAGLGVLANHTYMIKMHKEISAFIQYSFSTNIPSTDTTEVKIVSIPNEHALTTETSKEAAAYIQCGKKIYKTNVKQKNVIEIGSNDIGDPVIKDWFDTGYPQNGTCTNMCRGLKQEDNFLGESIIHKFLSTDSMLEKIKQKMQPYHALFGKEQSLDIVQVICNKEDCCHYYLLKGTPDVSINLNKYRLMKFNFKPESRILKVIDALNTQSKIGANGLCAGALYSYYSQIGNFAVSEAEVRQKMGLLYNDVSREIRVAIDLPTNRIGQIDKKLAMLKLLSARYLKRSLGYTEFVLVIGVVGANATAGLLGGLTLGYTAWKLRSKIMGIVAIGSFVLTMPSSASILPQLWRMLGH